MAETQPGRILIVEDDSTVASLQQQRLSRGGFETVAVTTPEAALDAVRAGGIELILLDHNLPNGRTGLEFYTDLKSLGHDLPVIMVTARSDEKTIVRALRAGARDFITKSAAYLDYLPEAVSRVLQQVRLTKELAESQALLAGIVNTAKDAIITLDAQFRVTTFNPAAESIFCISSEQARGQSLCTFIPTDLNISAGVVRRIPGNAEFKHGIRNTGEQFPLEGSLATVQFNGRTFYTIVVRDITEKKALESQVLHAQRMESVGTLAGGVAHEFNNLLQAIRGYTQYGMQGLATSDQRYQDLEQALKATDRAAVLTRQLLTFGRRQSLERIHLDPNQVVSDLGDMLRPLLGAKVELQLLLDNELPNICADAGQLQQVLLNLCINSRDAMPSGGRLTIQTEQTEIDAACCGLPAGLKSGRYVVLTVADNGCGMSAETKQRVFEPFFTTKQVGEGTGLGLAVAYGIVQQHEGVIQVRSEPGEGTTFQIFLPAVSGRCGQDDQHEAARRLGPLTAELGMRVACKPLVPESLLRTVRAEFNPEELCLPQTPG